MQALTVEAMEEIPLGAVTSKLYEQQGMLRYMISPILGYQINFHFDVPVTSETVLRNSDEEVVLKGRSLRVKMSFKPCVAGLEKVRLVPYLFGIIPFGIYFGEISLTNKRRLRSAFDIS